MRIAHISDLHWRSSLPGSAEIETRLSRLLPVLFEDALAEIVAHRPDILVVTGDLLDYPLEEMDNQARQAQGLQDLRAIRSLLDDSQLPYMVVFGNHDHVSLFGKVFADAPREMIAGEYRFIAFFDAEGPHSIPLRVGEERKRFENVLDCLAPQMQVHIQHYLVWPERNSDSPHSYGDGPWMRDQIAGSGCVRLVLSGHYHRGVEPIFDKGVWFVTVPAFCEPPHPYWLYDLEDDNLKWTEHRVSV